MLDHVPTICRFCVPEKHLPLLLQSISNLLNTRFRSISSSSSLFPNGDGHCQSFHREKRAELLRATIIKRHLGFFFLRLHPTFLAKKKTLHWTNTSACMSCSMCVSSLHILTNYDWSLTASSSSAPNQKRIKY